MAIVELPLQTIKNANLTWVRQDLGPMDDLIADIRANGIQKPLLVAADYLMFDGARRLIAAEKLGIKYVPVIICRNWPTLAKAVRENQDGSYPMNWLELRDLWERVFKGLHEGHRRDQAAATRRRNAALMLERQMDTYNYSGFTQDLAVIYGVTPATIKILRDSLTRLETSVAGRFPKFRTKVLKIIQEASPQARDMNHGRALKTISQRLLFNRCTEAEALNTLVKQINTDAVNAPLRYSRKRRNLIDEEAPIIPVAILENFTELLENVAAQASTFRNFHTTLRHRKRYEELIARTLAATTRIYRLRRRLESVLDNAKYGITPGIEEEA